MDCDGDGKADARFDTRCRFVLQLRNGKILSAEADRKTALRIGGVVFQLDAYVPAIISGVSEAGLWQTDDLGGSWHELAPADREQIHNRPHQIVFDPADPRRFWTSGCYDASPFMTADGGKTFQRLGNLTHMDGIGIVKSIKVSDAVLRWDVH